MYDKKVEPDMNMAKPTASAFAVPAQGDRSTERHQRVPQSFIDGGKARLKRLLLSLGKRSWCRAGATPHGADRRLPDLKSVDSRITEKRVDPFDHEVALIVESERLRWIAANDQARPCAAAVAARPDDSLRNGSHRQCLADDIGPEAQEIGLSEAASAEERSETAGGKLTDRLGAAAALRSGSDVRLACVHEASLA